MHIIDQRYPDLLEQDYYDDEILKQIYATEMDMPPKEKQQDNEDDIPAQKRTVQFGGIGCKAGGTRMIGNSETDFYEMRLNTIGRLLCGNTISQMGQRAYVARLRRQGRNRALQDLLFRRQSAK